MFRSSSRKRRFGFTLVEVLVTTVVVGVMAAVVIPAVVKQATAGDPARVASDLSSVKSAMELFAQNVRPRLPGDIEDLINSISTSEEGVDGTVYTSTNTSKWNGPYIEWATTSGDDAAESVEIFKSGGNAILRSALYRCPASDATLYSAATSTSPCTFGTGGTANNTSSAFVAVRIEGITANSEEFLSLNEVIDGVDEGTTNAHKQDRGLLRQNSSGTIFYLAVPFSSP
jgi:prepilin-type N-terminal cleavage/methylation domain-containing protein